MIDKSVHPSILCCECNDCYCWWLSELAVVKISILRRRDLLKSTRYLPATQLPDVLNRYVGDRRMRPCSNEFLLCEILWRWRQKGRQGMYKYLWCLGKPELIYNHSKLSRHSFYTSALLCRSHFRFRSRSFNSINLKLPQCQLL